MVLDGLFAPVDELANDHIPAITFPLRPEDNLSPHPNYGFLVSRTRILLGFNDDATVTEANAAIQSANVVIIGGLAKVGTLLVEAEDTPDFSGLKTALDAFRGDPAVDFAAMSPEIVEDEIPQPAEKTLFDDPNDWRFDQSEIGLPTLGTGGNWGTEASRLPQMWMFHEEVVTRGNYETIRTGLVDTGNEPHPDLDANLSFDVLCKPTPDGPKCTEDEPITDKKGNPNSHGQHTAGILGAVYDNDSFSESGRSIGISGANPFARITSIAYHFQTGPTTFEDIQEVYELILDKVSDLRVLSISLGPPSSPSQIWWGDNPTFKACGPGIDDDGEDSSAVKDFCTFNNEDRWLTKIKNFGGAAENIAEYASFLRVLIVKSAGNTSDDLCIGTGVNSDDCTDVKIRAINASGFARASANWDVPFPNPIPNPIVIVESISRDRKRAGSSNIGGDISAPGVGILSTVLDGK